MKTMAFVLGCAVGLGQATPASATDVWAQNPQSVVEAMQKAGYRALLDTDDVGDPMIRSAQGGTDFVVFFYNCTENTDCRTIQFDVGYSPPNSATLQSVNTWNRERRFGRAHLASDGTARLQMDVDLDDGGLSQALFEDNLEFWITVMSQFAAHVG